MALPPPQTREFIDRMAAVAAENRAELDQSSQSLEEITLLINQTHSEVDRLAQREVQLANRVREMEANMDAFNRNDIRDIMRTSHETELRLFMMRGQLEQLQERQQKIREFRDKLRLLIEIAEGQVRAEEDRRSQDERKTSRLRRRDTAELNAARSPFEDVIKAQEAERGRVARKIVDGPAQTLANIILEAEICERLIDRDVEQCRTELQTLRDMSTRALHASRRIIYELKPLTLTELGVTATLRRYLTDVARTLNIKSSISGPDTDDHLADALRVALYRLLQEVISTAASLNNIQEITVDIRYEEAQAIGRVEITAPGVERAGALHNLADDEAIRERLNQLEADLQPEYVSEDQARMTLVIPLA